MALSKVKSWVEGEVLTDTDLNAEFDNIYNNQQSIGTPRTEAWDMDGQELILDGDGDSSFHADTDDQLDLKIGGVDSFQWTANGYTSSIQPCFLAVAASQINVTGNTGGYTIQFTTEVFDQGSDFDGTSTFTAPVTGRYLFAVQADISGMTSAADSAAMTLITSNRTYRTHYTATNNMPEGLEMSIIQVADMDAADTVTVVLTVNGESSNVVDIQGGTPRTSFGGCLLA